MHTVQDLSRWRPKYMFPSFRYYPRTLLIKNEVWEIKFVRKMENNMVGLCDPGDKIIYIKMGQSRCDLFKTFIHEWMHALEEEYCIEVPHKVIYSFEDAIVESLIENIDDILASFAKV